MGPDTRGIDFSLPGNFPEETDAVRPCGRCNDAISAKPDREFCYVLGNPPVEKLFCPWTVSAEDIHLVNELVLSGTIEVETRVLANRVPARPSPRARAVVPVSVVEQICFIILVFGRKPKGVRISQIPGPPDDLPEGAFEASLHGFYRGLES